MNQSLHALCHGQRVKAILSYAVFGSVMCVTSAGATLADDLFELSSVGRTADSPSRPVVQDVSAHTTPPKLPQLPVDRSLTPVNLPAQWADLSRPKVGQKSTAMAVADHPPCVDFDRPWIASPNVAASVHVGPAPSAFTPAPFRGARHLSAAPASRQLRPIRLPPTGYFDESMTSARIATGPNDSRLPFNLPSP